MNANHRLPASKSATVAAVGEHAYKPALRNVPAGEVWVELIPEPDNPYDSNAISVRYRGNVITYIPRDRTGLSTATIPHEWWRFPRTITTVPGRTCGDTLNSPRITRRYTWQ